MSEKKAYGEFVTVSVFCISCVFLIIAALIQQVSVSVEVVAFYLLVFLCSAACMEPVID